MVWNERLRQKMEERGWTAVELAKRAGIDYESVAKYLKGIVKQPRGSRLEHLADALGVTIEWLRDGTGPANLAIPVVGYVSGGDGWTPFDDHAQGAGLDEIDLTITGADPIAIAVRGHSMAPAYRDGDHLICSRQHGVDLDNAVNHDCVVKTMTGEYFIKRLLKTAIKGRYRLRSYNADFDDIDDIEVEWAAPVMWVRKKV